MDLLDTDKKVDMEPALELELDKLALDIQVPEDEGAVEQDVEALGAAQDKWGPEELVTE